MIGAKLSDQRNSRNAGRFKSTNQRLAYSGSPPQFFPPFKSVRGSQALIGNANATIMHIAYFFYIFANIFANIHRSGHLK